MVTVADADRADQTRMVVEGLLDFVEKEVVPIEAGVSEILHDPRRCYQEDGREVEALTAARKAVRLASARAGYYAMFCPAEIGGGGLGETAEFRCWEALHHRYGPGELLVYRAIAHWASGPSAIWSRASSALQRDVLPGVIAGELQGSFGMSEPDAGSDAWRMRTSATRDGDGWRLTGSKQWTSFAPTADYVLTFAVTDPAAAEARKGGISCFYVPTASAGFAVESVIRLFGEIGGREAILSFDNVWVEDTARLGEVGRGFELAMLGATRGRFYNTARSVGLSRWALERSVEYAQVRRTMGKPIGEHQSIQNLLADCATEIYAARMMGLDCVRRAEAGEDVRREAAMAKLFATNTATRTFDRAMQIHGGMGLTNELRLHEGWKTARTIRIADGTDEILRGTIAKALLRGNVGF